LSIGKIRIFKYEAASTAHEFRKCLKKSSNIYFKNIKIVSDGFLWK